MRNVTITLDEETALWARIEAARRDTSVSRLVGELLQEYMLSQRGYDEAKASYQARRPHRLKGKGRYPAREDLHDRGHLR